MIQSAVLAFWKQTRFNTCGPACLMTALHELGKSGLSESREQEIWTHVKHPLSLGSLPSRMAMYAASQGLNVKLLHRNIAPPDFKMHWKTPRKILHNKLIRTYYETAKEAESQGLPTEYYQEEQEILHRIVENHAFRVIYLIVDDDGVLHFILAREKGCRVAVMDPYFGLNRLYDQPDFLNKLGGSMVGYAILMAP